MADFTKHLFAIRQALAAEIPSTAKIEAPDTSKDGPVPVHPGAAAYIDGELKTFFDRYNDLLYWGLMMFRSSARRSPGCASYTKSDDRLRRMKALDKLLDIIAVGAHRRNDPGARRIAGRDRTRSTATWCARSRTTRSTRPALMAFQVSLEQARAAIADRRAVLVSNPPRPRAAVASA